MTDADIANRRARIERIASAFAAVPHVNASYRNETLDKALRRLARQNRVPLPLETFEALAARIEELTMLVAQNALVADDLPHTGWGVPAGFEPEPQEPLRPELPSGTVRCSEVICEQPAEPVGPHLYQCPSGHLTIHADPQEDSTP